MNQRNVLLAVVMSALLLLGWDALVGYLYPGARNPAQPKVDTPAEQVASSDAPVKHSRTGGLDAASLAIEKADLKTALAGGNRLSIDSPRLAGSIDLATGAIDDIVLKDYRESVEKGSDPVRLFSPAGTPAQEFAEFGFLVNGQRLPAGPWRADGARLTPTTPVTLSKQAAGITYRIRFSIDANYMIRAEQRVDNTGAAGAVVQPYALINRTDRTASQDMWIAHSGPMGAFGGTANYDVDYSDLVEDGPVTPQGRVGWTGFTDIYWLAALVPQSGSQATAGYRSLGNTLFRADLLYAPVTLAPGSAVSRTTQLFAGAKEMAILDAYEEAGVPQFSFAIDWGWFRWFERPFLWLLQTLFELAGNFGVAIILLTVIVRAALFPIAQKGFASMAAMKAIQPKMKELQTKYKDDKLKQQQEMQALFKSEGVNPLAGCLPMLLQMPILYALYKVFVLAIDMRHQPFVLWIKDLSAPDPATILNLFGLLPFTPPSFLAIGVLALLLGVTMWLTFKLNPAPADPVQQQMFAIMPWVLMFAMAPFAAGLLLYWTTSNILTIAQQKYLYAHPPSAARGGDGRARGRQGGGPRMTGTGVSESDAELAAEQERRAQKLFSGRVDFLLSAPELKFLPEPIVPEIAFCGRSNVGKSSLLNALTGRRAIARASVTPGRTQELNFFEVGDPTLFRLVDMPGYGFAKAPVKVVERWKQLVRTYLRGRQVLSRVLVLVDARHGLKDVDREMMAMLDAAAVSYRVVLTKADKLKASELEAIAARTQDEARKHVAAFPQLHVTSAEKGLGIAELRAAVLSDAGI